MPTKIEWTHNPAWGKGETWNPIAGCTKCSPGCDNCYAERMAKRLKAMGRWHYENVVDAEGWTGKIKYNTAAMQKPLCWRKPRTVFVCSMSDLFHRDVTFGDVNRIMHMVRQCTQHVFIALTKRAERQRYYWSEIAYDRFPCNLITGVTCCTQEELDRSVPILLDTPATCRMVSIEPMLGQIHIENEWMRALDWIILGGESGPGARPMKPEWVRQVRDQSRFFGTPFLFKQWGGTNKKKAGRLLDGKEWNQFPELNYANSL